MLPSLPCDSLWTPEALVEFSYLPNPKRSGISRTPEAPVKFPMALPNAPALRNSWLNTFVTSTHDATLGSFETYLSNTSVNLRLIVAGTEPSVAFLVAHPGRQVKLVHHRHHDNGTPWSPSTNEVPRHLGCPGAHSANRWPTPRCPRGRSSDVSELTFVC